MARTGAFEANTNAYDQWFDKHPAAYLSELAALRRALPKGRGLEVGVGTGRFAGPLGIRIGVEPSGAMRRAAFQRGVEAIDGIAEELKFQPNWFDFVLFVNTICFIDDIRKALSEAKRVLKPGGAVVTAFIDRESFLGKRYEERKSGSLFYRDAIFHTPAEVEALLTQAGLVDVSFMQTIFKDPEEIVEEEEPLVGFGLGAFVVARAVKKA